MAPPSRWYLLRARRKSTISSRSAFASSIPATSANVIRGLAPRPLVVAPGLAAPDAEDVALGPLGPGAHPHQAGRRRAGPGRRRAGWRARPERPDWIGRAEMTTPCCSSRASRFRRLAKVGTRVSNCVDVCARPRPDGRVGHRLLEGALDQVAPAGDLGDVPRADLLLEGGVGDGDPLLGRLGEQVGRDQPVEHQQPDQDPQPAPGEDAQPAPGATVFVAGLPRAVPPARSPARPRPRRRRRRPRVR